MARLYHSVDLDLPLGMVSKEPGTSILRGPVTQSIRELTVRNGPLNRRRSVYSRRRKSDAGSIEVHVNGILDKIPMKRLKSFALVTPPKVCIAVAKMWQYPAPDPIKPANP